MGGIMLVTPYGCLSDSTKKTIERSVKGVAADACKEYGFLPLETFHRDHTKRLVNIEIKDVNSGNTLKELQLKYEDFLWLYFKKSITLKSIGWNGFMEKVYSNKEFEQSLVVPLRFVNHVPSNYDTTYTVLREAHRKCVAIGQKHTLLTKISLFLSKHKKLWHVVEMN